MVRRTDAAPPVKQSQHQATRCRKADTAVEGLHSLGRFFFFRPNHDGLISGEMQAILAMKTGGAGFLMCAEGSEAGLTNVVDTFVVSLVHIMRFANSCKTAAAYNSG
jgi:hypothetical protein